MALNNCGKYDQAQKVAESILSQYTYSENSIQYSHALYSKAFLEYMQGHGDKALAGYQKMVDEYPDCANAAEAYREIARLYYFDGKLDEAKATVEKLIAKCPKSPLIDTAKEELALLNQKINYRNTKTAEAKQEKVVELSSNLCGPVAVQLLLSHYGINEDLKAIAQKAEHDPAEGTSFAGLAQALKEYGFQAQGYKLSHKALTKMAYPVIVQLNHRQKDHFVVLEKMDERGARFSDYQGVHQVMENKEFKYQWTGYALAVTPSKRVKESTASRFIPISGQKLTQKLMETVMGGNQLPSPCNRPCPNNHVPPSCPKCNSGPNGNAQGGYNPGMMPSMWTDENGNKYEVNPIDGSTKMTMTIGGGATNAVGGGSGNSATSLSVSMANGWAHTTFPEMALRNIPGVGSIVVNRSYSSSRHNNDVNDHYGDFGRETPWGTKWTFNIATFLLFIDGDLYWIDDIGNSYCFTLQGSVYKPLSRYGLTQWFTVSGSDYTLNKQDGSRYVFHRIGTSDYARLEKMITLSNVTVSCEYTSDTSRYLSALAANETTKLTFGYTNGKLTSITDPFNRVVNYWYDSQGDLVRIEDPDGYSMYYLYNSLSQITATRDSYSAGSINIYTYTYGTTTSQMDDHWTPRCIAITDCLGNRTEFTGSRWWGEHSVVMKDSTGTLVKNGITYHFNNVWDKLLYHTYDNQTLIRYIWAGNDPTGYGQITATYDMVGHSKFYMVDSTYGSTTAYYDETGLKAYSYYDNTLHVITCAINEAGNKTFYEYNNLRLLTLIIGPTGERTQLKYDSYGNLTCSIDPLGQVSESIYDSQGIYLLMQISPSKATTHFYYDSWGRQTAVKNPKGYISSFGYDTMHRLIWSRDALGGLTQTEYYVNGLVKKVTDARNYTTEYEYDLRNRLTKEIYASGKYTQYWYDSLDRTTCKRDSSGQKSYITYDNWGHYSTRYYESGTTYSYSYDSVGQLISLSDHHIGGNHSFSYDSFGQTTSYQNPWGTTTYTYDTYGRRIGLKDPDGNTYEYIYDFVDRLFMVHNFTLDQFTMYSYDSIGRRSMEIYPNGLITTYEFDTCGCGSRVTNNQIYKPTDSFNRTSLGVNWTTTGTLSIETNRLKTGGTALAIYTMGGSFSDVTVESSIIVTDNASSKNGYLVHGYSTGIYGPSFRYAGYDHGSGVLKIGHKNINDSTIYVDISTTIGWASGIPLRVKATASGPTTSLWMLEPSGYEKKLSYVFSSSKAGTTGLFSNAAISQFDDFILNNNTTLVARYAYDYDANGNRISVTDKNYLSTYYSYDSLNRLVYENRAGVYTRSYGYDSVGNRIWMYNGTSTTSYTYNNLNQLLSDGSKNYSYDSCGNLIQKDWGDSGWTYGWNEDNMMTSVYPPSGGWVSYLYDSFGKRVQKAGSTINGTKAVRYFYDGINVLLEKVSTQGSEAGWLNFQTQAAYTLAPSETSQIISVKKADGSNLFYHYDPIGNVILISDLSGDTTAGYYQEGFGNVMQTVGSADNNYHLTTKELDPDTGFYYFYARWYDPETGRFISEDPIRNLNRYYYVDNKPLTFVDYMGLVGCTPKAMEDYANCQGNKHPGYDKWKHCYISCHLNRCLLTLFPLITIDIGIVHEFLGWEDGLDGSFGDMYSNMTGIKCSRIFFRSCESCCDKRNPSQKTVDNIWKARGF